MMGLQTAANEAGSASNTSTSNKRKFEEDEQKVSAMSVEEVEDGPSAAKSPKYEQQPEEEVETKIDAEAAAVTEEVTSTTSTSSSSSSMTSITTTTTAAAAIVSPLIAGTPTIPANVPLILPPAPPPAEDSIAKLEAVAVPGETNWNCDPSANVDPISKLQAVAVPGETWGDSTRSTLATTLLTHADDLDDDDDDFEDDFDDDETILPSYSPIRYPCAPNQNRYIPAYPKPGYFPEPYQNCSRTGNNNGAQQYANRGYGWSQHGYYSPPYEAPPPSQQTIRCAENGKSYFELGSANYSSSVNHQFPGPGRHLKRCCDGRNMSCNNKQCYKERRLKMMNLSMFKLARFRQASDQSLYRSVLICNTLKSIEREIDTENKEFSHQQHLQQQQQQHHYHAPPPPHHLHQHQQQPSTPPPPPQSEYGPHYNGNNRLADKQQPQQHPKFSDISNSGSNSNYSRLQGSNTTTQSSNTYGTSTNEAPQSATATTTITTQLSSYDQQQQQQPAPPTASTPSPLHHHPLKDPQSGRATPFPATTSTTSGYHHDSDSGFGDDDCTRPINWGSVLSLSSQSALDPLNGPDLFVTSPSVAVSVSVNDVAVVTATNDNDCDSTGSGKRSTPGSSSLALSQSAVSGTSCGDGSSSLSDSSSENNLLHHHHHTVASSSSSSSTTTLTSLTTLTTSSSCDLNLTTLTTSPSPLLSSCASALQYHHHNSSTNGSSTGSSWDLAYLDMDLGTTHELYDMFPNCYKITSFNSDVDMLGLKTPMLEPSKVVGCDNDMDSFTTHIMVGS